ncbi:MAG: DUF1800 family protein [Saprospiraceae bacterium]
MLTNQKKIQHLYWRAGFGISLNELQTKSNQPIERIVNQLIKDAKIPTLLNGQLGKMNYESFKKMSKAQKRERRKEAVQNNMKLNALWVQQMANSKNPLLERMTLFWHGHFACINKSNPYLSENQNNTIRQYALGSFKDLVLAISKDPAMIRFLNNQQNKKNSPNENYARELMELFTIGRGNYTENDIKEAARAFTGWHSNLKAEFYFNERQHDFGEKTFMGKTGNFDGEDIIDIILENKQTARFIATKVYRYFVNEKVNKKHIEELTETFFNADYNIETLMRKIFTSDWFYDASNIGSKIKSPIDLLVGITQTLNIQFEDVKSVIFIEKILGQVLYNPPNVAGWPSGKSWIDNASLMVRLNLVNYLFQTAEMNITEKPEFETTKSRIARRKLNATLNTRHLVKSLKDKSEDVVFGELSNWLIQSKLKFKKADLDEFTTNHNSKEYIESLTMRLMTLPEYQLC